MKVIQLASADRDELIRLHSEYTELANKILTTQELCRNAQVRLVEARLRAIGEEYNVLDARPSDDGLYLIGHRRQ